MKTSPTQRSLKLLRSQGWLVAVTERWNPFAKVRQDLFGFIDLLCIKGDKTLAVQTTSAANAAARVDKVKAMQSASLWLESPGRAIVVHAWAKQGARGKRKLWHCREVHINAQDEHQSIVQAIRVPGQPTANQNAP